MRDPEELGQGQAWYYPHERTLLLWECYLYDHYRQGDPRADDVLKTVWQRFEALLIERVPDATHLVTTREDDYDQAMWQEFLATQGYVPLPAPLLRGAAFAKEINR
jgi:hypothetical protein